MSRSPNFDALREQIAQLRDELRTNVGFAQGAWGVDGKIHANMLAQSDNLILLRMNSTVDIDHLANVFGFVPATLLHQAAAFRLGDGLVAGKISSHALRYQGARRWTREGGADVPATWASSVD